MQHTNFLERGGGCQLFLLDSYISVFFQKNIAYFLMTGPKDANFDSRACRLFCVMMVEYEQYVMVEG